MKKLKLKALELGASELLSRDQLKNVLGGDGSGGGCTNPWYCTKCCTPDGKLCGQCNTAPGPCQGNGVITHCTS